MTKKGKKGRDSTRRADVMRRAPGSPTLALAMIVKNEEKVLARCLDSVKGIVDEMVIVDTGSTDRTVEIAESYGALVVEHPWNNDFSEARNVALEHVRSDWVIQLDADEELVAGRQPLTKLMSDKRYDAYLTPIVVAFDMAEAKEKLAESFASKRFFRSSKNLRYTSPIHEYINGPESSRLSICDLIVVHFGPALDEEADQTQRRERNFSMLGAAIEREPENPYLYFCLGNEFFLSEDFEAALASYQRGAQFAADPNFIYVPTMMRNVAACLSELGYMDNAFALLKDLQREYPQFTDLFFLEGELAIKTGDVARAERLFSQCLKMGESPAHLYSWGGTGSWRAEEGLQDARRRLSGAGDTGGMIFR